MSEIRNEIKRNRRIKYICVAQSKPDDITKKVNEFIETVEAKGEIININYFSNTSGQLHGIIIEYTKSTEKKLAGNPFC